MFTERHHIPLPAFVLLGKTNSSLLAFSSAELSGPRSSSWPCSAPAPGWVHFSDRTVHTVLGTLLHPGLKAPYLQQDCLLETILQPHQPWHFSTICSYCSQSSSAASSSLLSAQLIPSSTPSSWCTSFLHWLKLQTTSSWVVSSMFSMFL